MTERFNDLSPQGIVDKTYELLLFNRALSQTQLGEFAQALVELWGATEQKSDEIACIQNTRRLVEIGTTISLTQNADLADNLRALSEKVDGALSVDVGLSNVKGNRPSQSAQSLYFEERFNLMLERVAPQEARVG